MEKDYTITELLNRTGHLLDKEGIQIADHWEADLCAIGLKKNDRLIYISTYSSSKNEVVRYDADLELLKNDTEYTVLKELRDLSEEQLIAEIERFFHE